MENELAKTFILMQGSHYEKQICQNLFFTLLNLYIDNERNE